MISSFQSFERDSVRGPMMNNVQFIKSAFYISQQVKMIASSEVDARKLQYFPSPPLYFLSGISFTATGRHSLKP